MNKRPLPSIRILVISMVFLMSLTSLLTITTPVYATITEYTFCGRGAMGEAIVSLPGIDALFVINVGDFKRSNYGPLDMLAIMIDVDQDPATVEDQIPWVYVTDNKKFADMLKAEYELMMMDGPQATIVLVSPRQLQVWSHFDYKRITVILRKPITVPTMNEDTNGDSVVIPPLIMRLRGCGCGTWEEEEWEYAWDSLYYEYSMRNKRYDARGLIIARTRLGKCRWPVDSASVSFRVNMRFSFGLVDA